MAITVRTSDEAATENLAQRLAQQLSPGAIIALQGALGVGKTVFVRGLARGLGISEAVTSPSFTIVSEYVSAIPLIHIDLYRTTSDEELELLGLDDLLARPAIIAIEWAEKCMEFLPEAHVRVDIRIDGNERIVSIEGIEYEHPDD